MNWTNKHYKEAIMTAGELIEILKTVNPDMKVFIEGRDSTGEYCDADEMTEKNIHICDERVVIIAE